MNPNEKTLGQVARSSYDPYVIETAAWDHVARAVITEHERRKAEQVKPEPFAAEKAAFAAGKTIQCRDSKKPWMDCDSTPGWFHDVEYRVKPDPVMGQLGPDDVPIGAEFQHPTWMKNERVVPCVLNEGIVYPGTEETIVQSWETLHKDGWLWRINDGKGWVPCSKIKPE